MKYFIEIRDFIYYRRKIVILVVGGLFACLVSFFLFFEKENNIEYFDDSNEINQLDEKDDINFDKDGIVNDEKNNDVSKLVVDIKGAVINPGIYEVDEGLRVGDVITLAGGLLQDADTSNINLSKKVTDEMVIVVSKKENVSSPVLNNGASLPLESSSKGDDKISINIASLEELMSIKGIGETKAKAIIDYRNKNGNFKSIDDLLEVSGIGESTLAKIKDFIKL